MIEVDKVTLAQQYILLGIDNPIFIKAAQDGGMTPSQFLSYNYLILEQSNCRIEHKINKPKAKRFIKIRRRDNEYVKRENFKDNKLRIGVIIGFAIIILLNIGIVLWINKSPAVQSFSVSSPTPISTPVPSTVNTLPPPLERPYSGQIIIGEEYNGESSKVTINTNNDDFYVFLDYSHLSDGKSLSYLFLGMNGIYVRANDTVTVDVPCGTATIKYASGKNWHGPKYRFNEKYDYKTEAVYDFVNYDVQYDSATNSIALTTKGKSVSPSPSPSPSVSPSPTSALDTSLQHSLISRVNVCIIAADTEKADSTTTEERQNELKTDTGKMYALASNIFNATKNDQLAQYEESLYK